MKQALAWTGAALAIAGCLSLYPPAGLAQGIGPGGGSFDPADNTGLAPTGGPVPNADDAAREKADAAAEGADADKPSKPEPPPSLPGSHARPVPVAPMDKNPSDMNPNEALFDAINRGDTAAARDALSRGADPNAHNVLGLTPIDEAVDLGRNDISFLLLSERANTEADVASAAARPVTRVAAAGSGKTPATITAHAVPVPSAGFLGFGGGS